jgi:poly(3-hydroxybutyrate) depolymerase
MDGTMSMATSKNPATPVGSCPAGVVDACIDSAFAMYASAVRASAEYWSSLLNRRATPLDIVGDMVAYGSAASQRNAPRWATPHTIVAEWPLARLRDFSDPHPPADAVPTLLLPPQAGHDSCVVDFAPDQSQVRTALDAGLRRLYSLDWRAATTRTSGAGIDAYLAVVQEAVDRLGGKVNMVGDCQGGWLAVIYAAIRPEALNTLTIAGAPVDFHAGEPLIHDWVKILSPLGFYRALVAANGGVVPGDALLTGFKLLQPEAELDRQLRLLAHVRDQEHVERYRRFEDWFQHTQPIAGEFYLWIVEHLFQRNELVAGQLTVGGGQVDLGAIRCPLYLLAGLSDHITPPPQVFALADFVSTPAADISRRTTGGGHLGLFMGHEALRSQWTPIFAEIAAR